MEQFEELLRLLNHFHCLAQLNSHCFHALLRSAYLSHRVTVSAPILFSSLRTCEKLKMFVPCFSDFNWSFYKRLKLFGCQHGVLVRNHDLLHTHAYQWPNQQLLIWNTPVLKVFSVREVKPYGDTHQQWVKVMEKLHWVVGGEWQQTKVHSCALALCSPNEYTTQGFARIV
eukprot:4597595-Amphidinium_carterae.1